MTQRKINPLAKMGIAAAITLSTLFTPAANEVQAQEPQQGAQASPTPSSSYKEPYDIKSVLKDASKYSSETGGIGIVIHYGPGNEVSADTIGQNFVRGIQKRGENAEYFVTHTAAPGASLTFTTGQSFSNRYNVEEAVKNIDNIVSKNVTDRRMRHFIEHGYYK
ncbi:MAG: hypothetical protein IT559_08720 [Alphaproteobacteria bacterium]|nr:hypothetical protein [Alphaproteobacteria bacterium]